MASVSIRLPKSLLAEADRRAKALNIPRAEYIRRAIEAENKAMRGQEARRRLVRASRRVRQSSLRVNAEFAAIEDAPDAAR